MECAPTANVETASDADPLPIVAAPNAVVPSRNCTVPAPVAGDTVAVKLTDWPAVDGFEDAVKVIVDVALFTVWVSTAEVLAAVFASPLWTAVIECAPTANVETASDADPPPIVAVPSAVVPSRNCTVPAPVAGDTVAVKVTDWPTVDGFTDGVNVVVDTALFTVWVSTAEVLAAVFVSPP
jgi:hypothetical protein